MCVMRGICHIERSEYSIHCEIYVDKSLPQTKHIP